MRTIAFTWLAAVFVGVSIDAAPQLVCYTVGPGDTAARLAFRLTGDERNAHAPTFQIFDPMQAAWIPKVSYPALRPGWRACVPYAKYAPPSDWAAFHRSSRFTNTVFAVGWWWVPLLISASAFLLNVLGARADRHRNTARELETFGRAFVHEFERPLLESTGHGPHRQQRLQSRLSMMPNERRIDIFLAPGAGSRYPNLSDHRKNVEYDINRVMTSIDHCFVLGNLTQQDQWVVIPFMKAG